MFVAAIVIGLLTAVEAGIPLNMSMSSFPTRREQVDLLLNVQEVFQQVKLLVSDESKATDESVESDISGMVKRGREILSLYQELVISRISSFSNTQCALEPKDKIRKITQEGRNLLEGCTQTASNEIVNSTVETKNMTNAAMSRGQELLDALGDCSKKPAFQLISCYKKIIDTDVVPVKTVILDALKAHKIGHLKAIEIRNAASECVDTIVEGYQVMIDQQLKTALNC